MADREQFIELFLKYEADLRAFLAALVRNRQDCEEVFQETAMTLWRKHAEYDPQRPFGAWAKGIAAKKVLQCRTKSGRTPTPFSPETIGAIVDALERRERQRPSWPLALDVLEKCKDALPERSRNILALRYKEEWSVSRIAEHLDSTPAAITMAFARIRTRLRDCVQRHLDGNKDRIV